MNKPVYKHHHSTYLDTSSITEAEQTIDREHQRYKKLMQQWWETLTPKQKREEWKKDSNLAFYVKNQYVMTYKIIIGEELYVYMNGSLLYKRWLTHQYGKVFCNVWGHCVF